MNCNCYSISFFVSVIYSKFSIGNRHHGIREALHTWAPLKAYNSGTITFKRM